jgi:hypothetical protein
MVILVVSTMAGVSKLLYPHLNSSVNAYLPERYESLSKYILLNEGRPQDWGKTSEIPVALGFAEITSDVPYELGIDKVSRLNSENLYTLSYDQLFTILGLPEASFRIEVEPLFQVVVNLTLTVEASNETLYEFEVLTDKDGAPLQTDLKAFVVAEDYLEPNDVQLSDGRTFLDVTVPNNVSGPAMMLVLAKSSSNSKVASFAVYPFEHNSPTPHPRGTFLRLDVLNYELNVSSFFTETNLSDVYALSFNYSDTLNQISKDNQSALYDVPDFLDPSPTLIVVTGWNSTDFFAEWTIYPQIPVRNGADFEDAATLTDVFTYRYLVTIDSGLYVCKMWFGGPRE